MKNRYVTSEDITIIYIKYKTQTLECLIDTEDLDRLKEIVLNHTISVILKPSGFYVMLIHNHNKTLLIHRFIMNCPKGLVVDHIFHNTLDNRKSKLRIVSQGENMQNIKISSRNISGIPGVSWNEGTQHWIGQTYSNGTSHYVGTWKTLTPEVSTLMEQKRREIHPFINPHKRRTP